MSAGRFRDAADAEGFGRAARVGELMLPNGTVCATSDWALSSVMARAVWERWCDAMDVDSEAQVR